MVELGSIIVTSMRNASSEFVKERLYPKISSKHPVYVLLYRSLQGHGDTQDTGGTGQAHANAGGSGGGTGRGGAGGTSAGGRARAGTRAGAGLGAGVAAGGGRGTRGERGGAAAAGAAAGGRGHAGSVSAGDDHAHAGHFGGGRQDRRNVGRGSSAGGEVGGGIVLQLLGQAAVPVGVLARLVVVVDGGGEGRVLVKALHPGSGDSSLGSGDDGAGDINVKVHVVEVVETSRGSSGRGGEEERSKSLELHDDRRRWRV